MDIITVSWHILEAGGTAMYFESLGKLWHTKYWNGKIKHKWRNSWTSWRDIIQCWTSNTTHSFALHQFNYMGHTNSKEKYIWNQKEAEKKSRSNTNQHTHTTTFYFITSVIQEKNTNLLGQIIESHCNVHINFASLPSILGVLYDH